MFSSDFLMGVGVIVEHRRCRGIGWSCGGVVWRCN